MQRCRQDRPIADTLEGQSVIAADGEANRGFDRHGDPAAPAAGIAVHGIAVAHDVHREDAVLVEAAQPAKRDDGLIRDTNDIAQVLLHVDEGDVAEVLAVALVHRAGGKIDAHEFIEHQRLRRLRELHAVVGSLCCVGSNISPELLPLHRGRRPSPAFRPAPPDRIRADPPDCQGRRGRFSHRRSNTCG